MAAMFDGPSKSQECRSFPRHIGWEPGQKQALYEMQSEQPAV